MIGVSWTFSEFEFPGMNRATDIEVLISGNVDRRCFCSLCSECYVIIGCILIFGILRMLIFCFWLIYF